jgi:uncharacterized protein (TIGR03435 family)
MNCITKTLVAGGSIILAAALAAAVKPHFFPVIKDAYFEPDTDKLRLLPKNLVVVRPTHFPGEKAKMREIHENSPSDTRSVGRNVPLRTAIAEAYDCNPARVELPADAPQGGYDFLATTGQNAREDLKKAIERKLGYTAHRETRDMDVLGLKVEDPNLPGMKISPEGESANVTMKDGKLYFTHQPLHAILNGLSQGLSEPVVDETGLTNFYDFSVTWNKEIQNRMQVGGFDLNGVKRVLAGWGLRLEQDSQPMDVFVVQKAR